MASSFAVSRRRAQHFHGFMVHGRTTFRCSIFLGVLTGCVLVEKVDKHPTKDCACWAAQDSCKTNAAFMLGACAASCEKQASLEDSAAKIAQLEEKLRIQASAAEASAAEASKTEAKMVELEKEIQIQTQARELTAQASAGEAAKVAELEERLLAQTQAAEQASQAFAAEANKAAARIAELEERMLTQAQVAEQAAQASATEANNAAAAMAALEERLRAQTRNTEELSAKAQEDSSSKQARIVELEEEATRQAASLTEMESSIDEANKAASRVAELEEQLRAQAKNAEEAVSKARQESSSNQAHIAALEEKTTRQEALLKEAENSAEMAQKATTRITHLEEQLRAQTQSAEASSQAQQECASRQALIVELEEKATRQAVALKEAESLASEAHKATARIGELERQLHSQSQDAEASLQAQQECASRQALVVELEEKATREAADAHKATARIGELEEQLRAQTEYAEQTSSSGLQESSVKQARIAELEEQATSQAAALKEMESCVIDASKAMARISELEDQLRAQTRNAEEASAKAAQESLSKQARIVELEEETRQAGSRKEAELVQDFTSEASNLARMAEPGEQLRAKAESLKHANVIGSNTAGLADAPKEEEDWFSTYSQPVVEMTFTTIEQIYELLGNDTVEVLRDKANYLRENAVVALEYANYPYEIALVRGSFALEQAEPVISTLQEYVNYSYEAASEHGSFALEQAEPVLIMLQEYARPHVDPFLVEALIYIEAICFAFFSVGYPGSVAISFWVLTIVVAFMWYLLCLFFRVFLCGHRWWRRRCCCCCLPLCFCRLVCRLLHGCRKQGKERKQHQPTGNGEVPTIGSAEIQSFFIGDEDELIPASSVAMEPPPSPAESDMSLSLGKDLPDVKSPIVGPSAPEVVSKNPIDLEPDDTLTDRLVSPPKLPIVSPPVLPPPTVPTKFAVDSRDAVSAPPQGHVSALVSKAEARSKSLTMAPIRKPSTGDHAVGIDSSSAMKLEDVLKRIEGKIDTLVQVANSHPDIESMVKEVVKAVAPVRQIASPNQNQRHGLSLSV